LRFTPGFSRKCSFHASLLVLPNIAIASSQDGHFVRNACSLQDRNVNETCSDRCDKNTVLVMLSRDTNFVFPSDRDGAGLRSCILCRLRYIAVKLYVLLATHWSSPSLSRLIFTRLVREITESFYWLRHVCLVSLLFDGPQGTDRLPRDGFS
jgi:hypothetical protein